MNVTNFVLVSGPRHDLNKFVESCKERIRGLNNSIWLVINSEEVPAVEQLHEWSERYPTLTIRDCFCGVEAKIRGVALFSQGKFYYHEEECSEQSRFKNPLLPEQWFNDEFIPDEDPYFEELKNEVASRKKSKRLLQQR